MTIRFGAVFAFLPDGRRLVVSGTGPKSLARMASLATGQEIFRFDKPPPNVRGVAVSGDGARVALAALRDRVVLYDSQTGVRVQVFKAGNDADLSGLEFASDSHALLHSSWHGRTIMDAATSPAVRPLQVSGEYPDNTMYYATAFSPSGDRFAAVWFAHTVGTNISLFGWPSGDEISRLPCVQYDLGFCFNQIVFSRDGQSLLFSIPDGSVALWDMSSATPAGSGTTWIAQAAVAPGAGDVGTIFSGCLGFSPDGTILVYGQGSLLSLWAWPSGECLGKWRLPGRDPTACRVGFSPSGRDIAVSRWESINILVYHVADLINTRNINGNQ